MQVNSESLQTSQWYLGYRGALGRKERSHCSPTSEFKRLILIHFSTSSIFKAHCWQPGAVNIHQTSASHYTCTTLGCILCYVGNCSKHHSWCICRNDCMLYIAGSRMFCSRLRTTRILNEFSTIWQCAACQTAGPYRIISSHNSPVAIRGRLWYCMTEAF